MIDKRLILSVLFFALTSVQAAPVKEVDRIVAVINKGVITQQELDQRVAETIASMKSKNVALPPTDQLQRQVLDRMITEEAQVQFAQQSGIALSDSDLDRALESLAKQNKTTVDGMYARMQKEGLSRDRFRNEVRRELTIDRLRQREVDSKVTVTDTEVQQALKSGTAASRTDYRLAAILVAMPERADEKTVEARGKRAEAAVAALKAGKPFTQVSATYSDAPNAAKGGELGWRQGGTLPPELAQMLDNMKPGDISPPLRTPQGFYIFKLLERRGQGEAQMVEQQHVEHILIRTNEAVSEADAKARIDRIKQQIDQGASFEEMARLNSEDGSNTRGGDLGWISPGDTVPEFEQAMNALPVGTVSAPVRSPFGWHLIKVLEKRNQDVSADREKNSIRQQIRARKAETAYIDWVRQLRDSMFIQDRLKEQ